MHHRGTFENHTDCRRPSNTLNTHICPGARGKPTVRLASTSVPVDFIDDYRGTQLVAPVSRHGTLLNGRSTSLHQGNNEIGRLSHDPEIPGASCNRYGETGRSHSMTGDMHGLTSRLGPCI